MVFAKGASDSMATRLVETDSNPPDLPLADKFAGEGLRTLAFGFKTLEQEVNFESATAIEVETNLTLVGITAVEDLLQDDVASCIEQFR